MFEKEVGLVAVVAVVVNVVVVVVEEVELTVSLVACRKIVV